MRILIVESEPHLARHLGLNLRRHARLAVDHAATCLAAFDQVIEAEYDLIVLDLELPDGCGLELLRQWRGEDLATPILALSSRNGVSDTVAGFTAGADDYLTKPFAWEELLVRAQNLLKRRPIPRADVLRHGDLVLDRTRSEVRVEDVPVYLTAKEFGLLEYLMLHPGRLISRDTLAEHVWDNGYQARSNVVAVSIGRLRRKLEAHGRKGWIVTVKGAGYMLRRPRERAVKTVVAKKRIRGQSQDRGSPWVSYSAAAALRCS